MLYAQLVWFRTRRRQSHFGGRRHSNTGSRRTACDRILYLDLLRKSYFTVLADVSEYSFRRWCRDKARSPWRTSKTTTTTIQQQVVSQSLRDAMHVYEKKRQKAMDHTTSSTLQQCSQS